MLLVDTFPQVFQDVAETTNVSVEWLRDLELTLSNARPATSSYVYKSFVTDVYGKHLNGPHRVDIVERDGPSVSSPKMITILIGEVHGNEDGCGEGTRTMFRHVVDSLTCTSNVFLLLESFPHLVPSTVANVRSMSVSFKSNAHSNHHSMWNACQCIGNNVEYCNVNNKRIGQLILFRGFAFIVQSTVVFLDSVGAHDTVFHNLRDRIYCTDPREDSGLLPYDWITDSDRISTIRSMLSKARPKLLSFVPKLQRDDLMDSYITYVRHPILAKIDACIQSPNKRDYEELFTLVTELVSVATHFSIMESNVATHPHIVVVAGDKHRELILGFLKACLKEKMRVKQRFSSGRTTSCLYMQAS